MPPPLNQMPKNATGEVDRNWVWQVTVQKKENFIRPVRARAPSTPVSVVPRPSVQSGQDPRSPGPRVLRRARGGGRRRESEKKKERESESEREREKERKGETGREPLVPLCLAPRGGPVPGYFRTLTEIPRSQEAPTPLGSS